MALGGDFMLSAALLPGRVAGEELEIFAELDRVWAEIAAAERADTESS
jgi:hypothetical protein